jgi:hypothetical protein
MSELAWFERLEKRTAELFWRVERIEEKLNLSADAIVEFRKSLIKEKKPE